MFRIPVFINEEQSLIERKKQKQSISKNFFQKIAPGAAPLSLTIRPSHGIIQITAESVQTDTRK